MELGAYDGEERRGLHPKDTEKEGKRGRERKIDRDRQTNRQSDTDIETTKPRQKDHKIG